MGTLSFAAGGQSNLNYLFRATNGGTTFSSNLAVSAFDLFDDYPTVDDAIYFGIQSYYMFGKLQFDITTALVGTDVVLKWEYYGQDEDGVTMSWREIPEQQDDTSGFTNTGVNSWWSGLPFNAYPPTVNGIIGYYWVRCRLVSFSSISEGGRSNQVYPRDCTLYINNYTDEEPCTLEEIYQYMKINYPYLTKITKIGGFKGIAHDRATYDFRSINFWCNSRLLVKNEGFHQGCGEIYGAAAWCGRNNYAYLQMGTKVGDSLGTDGGWLIHHSIQNSFSFSDSSPTKIYNSLLKGKGTGYIATGAEWLGNIIFQFNFNPYLPAVMKNNLLESTLWLLNGMPDPFDGNKIVFNPRWGFIYNLGFTARNLDWSSINASSIMQFNNSMGNGKEFIFVDPITPLPLNAAVSPNLIYCSDGSNIPFSKVLYNDVSEGTFTDYTTECSDTEHDMPLYGDVGDYYYFAMNGTNGRFGLFLTVLADTTNDYGYEWEFYNSTDGWVKSTKIVENTNNFSNSGDWYPYSATDNYYTNTTINGMDYIWCRLKIVSKGTGEPVVQRIKYNSKTAVGDWSMQSKYTLGLTLTNADGDLIEGASVVIKHDGTEVYSGTTDENGNIPDQELLYLKTYLDPFGGGYQKLTTDTYDKYSIEIIKAGYTDYIGDIDMSQKQILSIALQKPDIPAYENLAISYTEDNLNLNITEDSLSKSITEDNLSINIEED